jgi:hypothetical protein
MNQPPSEPEYGMPNTPASSFGPPPSDPTAPGNYYPPGGSQQYPPGTPPIPIPPPPSGQPPFGAPTPYGPPPGYGPPSPPPYNPYGFGAAPPPFPREKKSKRGWWIAGIIGGVVLLCCCGVVAGLIGLGYKVDKDNRNKAERTVENYLEDLKGERYAKAYDRLCKDYRKETSLEAFTRDNSENPVVKYNVGDAHTGKGDIDYEVDADITFADGDKDDGTIAVTINSDDELEVCPK